MSEEFQLKDTGALQVESLVAFMNILGFKACDKVNGSFVAVDKKALKGFERISLSTAVRIYNAGRANWKPTKYTGVYKLEVGNVTLMIDAYTLNRAMAAKFIKTVKLQKTRKGVGVNVTGHMVSFAHKDYAALLGLA